MRTRLVAMLVSGLMLGGGVVGLAAAPAGAGGSGGHSNFSVGFSFLTGDEEVPGPGDDDGIGTFSYVTFGDKICYVLTARKIDPAVAAHIHLGADGAAGPIAINLKTPASGFSRGCITAVDNSTPNTADVLIQAEFDGIVDTPEDYYTNVHNPAFGNGAIRGQLD
jgi:hypothetical protein